MSIWELMFIAVGLSMDAFAVSVSKGLVMDRMRYDKALLMALFFGVFQALMPIAGFMTGSVFSEKITGIGHWVAFILLCFIGLRMVRESFESAEEGETTFTLSFGELILLAVATSIDALAVGVTFAFMEVSVFSSSAFIGLTTFIISFIGVVSGFYLGRKIRFNSELIGGIILISIGIKILIEGLLGR